MKTPTLFSLCLCVFALSSAGASDFYAVRDGIANSRYFFEKNQVGNQYLFFIGDTVLAGEGLKDGNLRYSGVMSRCFRKHYPDAGIIETRHCQPGGSWFARFRTSGGQAVFGEVICSGHLAILDFAAGDRFTNEKNVRRQVEEMLRQVVKYRNTHSTIIVYTLTPEIFAAYDAGRTPGYIRWCEEVAEHYGVPSVNLAKVAAEKILAGELTYSEFTQDGVNPTDAGAKIYSEAVEKFVDALMAGDTPAEVVRKTLPEPLFADALAEGRIIAYERTEFSSGWKPGQESPIKPFRHLLVTEKAGETLKMKFTGTEIGLLDAVGLDAAPLEFSVDGGPWQKTPLKYVLASKDGENSLKMRAMSLAEGLDPAVEHTFELRTGDGVSRLGGILLNGRIQDIYAGLTPLEKIDKIYAGMDKISYTPEPGRFQHLPKTVEKLKNGPALKMVLLGDSIMGNTSASEFQLLLERNYPECKIHKIASLRSSTGCKYYQEENRVQDYVLRHEPDLLVIGGISNGGDWEAVRSVVRQCRAEMPGLEVLLVTPVFGAVHDPHIRNWQYALDEAKDPFRFNLKKVAEEEKCAFFDMTAPWYQTILDSGKTYGWFMGDAVHANDRGCQIIGRLLEIYFSQP